MKSSSVILSICLAGLLLVAGGCGGEDAIEDDPRSNGHAAVPAAAPPSSVAAAGGEDELGFGAVRSFTVRLTGAVDTIFTGSEREGSAGLGGQCAPGSPAARLDLRDVTDLGYEGGSRSVGLVTEGPVGTGETGTFPLRRLEYTDGRTLPPVIYDARSGELEITLHDAGAASRRMKGSVRGTNLRNAQRDSIDLEMEFDINFACGVRG